MINPFFKNTGPHDINFLLKSINLGDVNLVDDKIKDILNSNNFTIIKKFEFNYIYKNTLIVK